MILKSCTLYSSPHPFKIYIKVHVSPAPILSAMLYWPNCFVTRFVKGDG